ncbi:MAG: Ig-like domain-containing protein, partial [bacterium]
DVTSNIILTEIDYGYSVRYIHAEPFDGARRYVVTIYASDFAYPPHNASISIEFTTGAELERAQFEFPLFVWTKVEDDSIVQTLSLGLDPVCGAGYDIGYDLPVPAIPPLAPYAYFIISDSEYPFISMLSRDIRNSGEPAHIWKIRVDNSGANCGLVWFPEFMLEGWIFELGKGTFDLPPAERDFVNMREISHYEFRRGDVIYIRASATPEIDWTPPRIINFYPPDGATNIIVNTRISCDIVDYESGVDRSSIMMWVQGENVSSRLSITEIPYGYNVVYQPVEPLPFLSRITVIVSANDLSYLRNAASDTVSFRTGSVLAPAWTETLYIGVTNETLDTVRMQLIIGLDEYGTDGFDFALDAVLPPPPPFGPYAFLIIEDTVWNVLGQDIRWIYDDDVEWKATLINFPQSGEGAAWVSWDRNMLTPEGNFIITAWRSSTIIGRANMRETDRFNLFGATSFTIRKFFGATSFCIIGRITLDGAERHDNTIIRLL